MKKMNRILFGLVALLATQPAIASLTTATQRLYGTLPSFAAAKTVSPAFYPKPTGTTFGTPGMPSQAIRPTTPILTPFMMQQRQFGQFPGQQFRPAARQQQSFWNRYNPANWFKASTSPYFSQPPGYLPTQEKIALQLIEFDKKATPNARNFLHHFMDAIAPKIKFVNVVYDWESTWQGGHVVIRFFSPKGKKYYDIPLETFTTMPKISLWLTKIMTPIVAAILGSWVLYNLIFGDDVEKAKVFELDYLNKIEKEINDKPQTFSAVERQEIYEYMTNRLKNEFNGNMNAPSKEEIINNIERAQNTKELYDIHQQIEHYLLVKAINASKPGWGTSVYEWFTRK